MSPLNPAREFIPVRAARRPTTSQIAAAVTYLMQAPEGEFATVIKWMQTREKQERQDDAPKRKRKQVLFDKRGHKVELYKSDIERMSKP